MGTPQTRLAIYLNDHLAGAEAGLQLLEALRQHEDPVLTRIAHDLYSAIVEDRDELTRIMTAAGVTVSPIRKAVGWLSEKGAQLKLAADDPVDGQLRTFELLEALAIGIHGKRALWDALKIGAVDVAALRSANYSHLIARADEQRSTVEVQRLRWAAAALTTR
jgi:hypothetical protein